MEIERKFLVNGVPELNIWHCYDIAQGYLSTDPEVRIRKKDNEFYITKKGDGTLAREEIETKIDSVTYEILLSLVKNNMIEKTRYEILIDNGVAELDVYHGALTGLKVVEVEFPSVEDSEKFEPLDWFGEEVTNDSRYKNRNLAKMDDLSSLQQLDFYTALRKTKK